MSKGERFVIQTFEDGRCIEQEFIAADQVDFEDNEGNTIDPFVENEYQPFDMVQPVKDDTK